MIKKYRKKPIVIKALKFDGTYEGILKVKDFVGESFKDEVDIVNTNMYPKYGFSKNYKYTVYKATIKTLEGDHKASPGDYIIQGVNGEFYPCKPDIFKKTYEEVV